MKIGRTVPPAAAPLGWRDLCHGVAGALSPNGSLRAREDEIRREFGVPHVFLVSSGAAALTLALTALKTISPRREVVIPAYTCFSVPAAILKAGLRPVLCDINPSTFDFDHVLLERAVGKDTLCVIAHHLFGVPSDVQRTRAFCRARGIFVIEDAAQAMGVMADGRKLGTVGDVGIFSLGRGKNITCGSGGVVVTSRDDIAAALAPRYKTLPSPTWLESSKDLVRLFVLTIFIRPRLYWIPASLPFLRLGETVFPKDVVVRRLSGFKAGLLRRWQTHLAQSNQIRSKTAGYFGKRIPGRPGSDGSHPYLRLPIFAATPHEKQRLYASSQTRGLGLSVAYPTPVSDIPEVRAAIDGRQFPAARRVAASLLTVPTHHWLTPRDKQAIAELCRDARIA